MRRQHRVRRFLLQCVEWIFVAAGLACAAWLYVTWRSAIDYELYARNELDHIEARELPTGESHVVPTAVPRDDALIGLLTIRRLDLSVAVIEGDSDRALRIAAGHLPETPMPWQEGNSAFAGHRDRFFNPLQNARRGDQVELVTRHGTLRYRVSLIRVVEPDDLSVLGPLDGADLTLITCYPFGYFGPAPQRFIVQAVKVVDVS